MENNNIINDIVQEKNILVYVDSVIDFKKTESEIHLYCKEKNINYCVIDFTDPFYSVSRGATIYYTNIPYSTGKNIRLLNTYIERKIDKIYRLEKNALIYIVG